MLSKKLIIVLAILMIAGYAYAERGAYIRAKAKGGGATAMDGITTPSDQDICYVFGTIEGFDSFSPYEFDSDSSASESGMTYIAPDDATAGRWIQMQPFFVFGTAGDLSGVTDQAGVVKMEIAP